MKATFALTLALLLPLTIAAQNPPDKPVEEGINSGNYNYRQSIELGGRFTSFTGSGAVYSTFVNLNPGLRLFEHTLDIRSLNHAGALFDNLSLMSFGYGGDPNNVTRLRVYKNRWYNFSGTFRRDLNYWDYNLLANPLNPVISNPSVAVTLSPHRFDTVRRMSDYNLTLLPQSRVRFRLGYARNINEGPSFSTFHEGTDILTFQGWKTTLNSYRLGVDLKLLPRTSISYDQFLHFYKGDTSWVDRNFGYRLSNGTPVDLGLPINTPAGQPCAAPISNATTTPPTVNPACNGYLGYERVVPVRTFNPTEQLSFQSNYFKHVDLAGRVNYSSSSADVDNYRESFLGLVSRSLQRQFLFSGPANAKRISITADLAATWHVSSKFRVVNQFRHNTFRIPGQWNSRETSLFGNSMLVPPNVFSPASCPPPYTASTCPTHSNSSGADIALELFSNYLGQSTQSNQFELEYDVSKRLGGRLGYRFRKRRIDQRALDFSDLTFFPTLPNRGACAGRPLQADGTCRTTSSSAVAEEKLINEHSLLAGIWAKPTDALRLSFDLEAMSADNTFTRISPRHLQHYKFRGHYRPVGWLDLGATINILENRNNTAEINNLQHNRSYAFSAVVARKENWGLDFGYQFNNVFSQINICYVSTPLAPGSSPCPTSAAFRQQLSTYDSSTNYAYANVFWKPAPRVTAYAGYNINSVNGRTLILNPNAPPGPLQFNYHQPSASLAVDLAKGLTWKTGWGYYGYNEKGPQDPFIGLRDFRGNLVSLALRYAF